MANEFKVKNGLIVENGLYLISYTGSSTDLMIISSTGSVGRTTSTAYLNNTYFTQNGNSFGATAVLGTNDEQALIFETNNTNRLIIDTNGNVGIGTLTPQSLLDISFATNGGLRLTSTSSANRIYTIGIGNSGIRAEIGLGSGIANWAVVSAAGWANLSISNENGDIARTSIGANGIFLASTRLYVNIGTSSHIGQVNRGAISQTADLIQWQDSGANVLSRILANGFLRIGTNSFVGSNVQPAIQLGGSSNGIYTDNSRIFFSINGTFVSGFSNTGLIGNYAWVSAHDGADINSPAMGGYRLTAAGLNAGISGNAAGDVGLVTSDLARLVALANGNVGIGTTTPTASLHIISQHGATAPSSNKALLVENLEGTKLFNIQSNAQIGIGSYSNGTGLHPITIYNTGKVFIKNSAGDSALDYSLLVDTNVGNTLGLLNGKLYVNQTITTFLNKGISIETNASTQSIAVFKISANNNWSYQNPSFKAAILIDGQYLGQSTNATFSSIDLSPILTTNAGYTGNLRGLYYNPDISGMTLGTHRAIETTSGDVVFSNATVSIGTYSKNGRLTITETSNNIVWFGDNTTNRFTINSIGQFVINGRSITKTPMSNTLLSITGIEGGGSGRRIWQIDNGQGNIINDYRATGDIVFRRDTLTVASNDSFFTLVATFSATTGSNTSHFVVAPTLNTTYSVGIFRGIYYVPTILNMNTAHRAIETTSGDIYFNSGNLFLTSLTASQDDLMIISATGGVGRTSSNIFMSSGLSASFYMLNGNSFGATAVFGTNDNNVLQIETNGTNRIHISTNSTIGLYNTNPVYALDMSVSNSINNNGFRMINAENGNTLLTARRNGSGDNIDFGVYIANTPFFRTHYYDNSYYNGVANFGIGITTPTTKFQISGTATIINGGFGVGSTNFTDNTSIVQNQFIWQSTLGGKSLLRIGHPNSLSTNTTVYGGTANPNLMYISTNGLSASQAVFIDNYIGTIDIQTGYGSSIITRNNSINGIAFYANMSTNNITSIDKYGYIAYNYLQNGTATNVYGFYSRGQYATPNSISTNVYDFHADEYINGNTSSYITNRYGLFLGYTNANTTNAYGVYQTSASVSNYFNGTVSIGTVSRTYKLNVEGTSYLNGTMNIGTGEIIVNNGGITIYGSNNALWIYDRTLNPLLDCFRVVKTSGITSFASRTYQGGFSDFTFITFYHASSVSSTLNINSMQQTDINVGGSSLLSFVNNNTVRFNYQTGSSTDLAILSSNGTLGRTSSSIFLANNYFAQNGNSFGATAVLGTIDNQALILETNDTPRFTIGTNGNISIGTTVSILERFNIQGNIFMQDGILRGRNTSTNKTGYITLADIYGNMHLNGTDVYGMYLDAPSFHIRNTPNSIYVMYIANNNISIGGNHTALSKVHIGGGDILIGTFSNPTASYIRFANVSSIGNSAYIGGSTNNFEINGGSIGNLKIQIPPGSDTSTLTLYGNGVNTMQLYRNQRVRIGGASSSNPIANLEIIGNGTSSLTSALSIFNTTNETLRVDDSGKTTLTYNTGYTTTTTDAGLILKNPIGLDVGLGVTTAGDLRLKLNNAGVVFLSNNEQVLITGTRLYAFNNYGMRIGSNISNTVALNSGSGFISDNVSVIDSGHSYNNLRLSGTISSTITGGLARGLYINPTITNVGTASVNYFAIETTIGDVKFNNGNVGIGIGSGNPIYKLHLSGDFYAQFGTASSQFWLHSNGSTYIDIGTGKSFFIRDVANSNNTMVRFHPAASAVTIENGYNLIVNSKLSAGTYGTTHQLNISGTQSYDSSVGINELKTQRELTTNSTVPSKIWNYTTSATQIVVAINAKVVGKSTLNPTDSIYVYLRGSVKSDITGTLYMMANPVYDVFRDDLTTDVTLAVNGNDIQILVTGTNDNWIWKAVVEYDIIS